MILLSERLEDSSSIAYLRVGRAKGRRRGKNVVQHLRVDNRAAVNFLEKVFGKLDPDLPLYGGSHSAFRRRWGAILEVLLVPTELGITQGGMRGGGCIHAFHGGMEISKLLESYLQECVASTCCRKARGKE